MEAQRKRACLQREEGVNPSAMSEEDQERCMFVVSLGCSTGQHQTGSHLVPVALSGTWNFKNQVY